MSTADDILIALHDIYGRLHGINAILDYEPRAVQAAPMIYTQLESMTRDMNQVVIGGRLVVYNWRWMSRLLIAYQDPQTAEQDLRRYVDELTNLLEDPNNRRLNGVVPQGEARIDEVRTGYASVDGTVYRIADIYTIVSDKIVRP